jgi:hypothetical protein
MFQNSLVIRISTEPEYQSWFGFNNILVEMGDMHQNLLWVLKRVNIKNGTYGLVIA